MLTTEQAAKRISTVLIELDNLRPWPDTLHITVESLAEIQRVNRLIDAATTEQELDAALVGYRKAWKSALE